jgi:hypothetical protein
MLRIRFLIVLALGFLAGTAAWADEVGFVDCSNHSDATQVFGKPRRTPEVVGSLPCGERFTILVYGFYFSRIQTKDGQIGYIYSSLIAVDRGATAAKQAPAIQTASEKTKIPSTRSTDAHLDAPASLQPQPAPSQPVATPAATFPTPAAVSPASPSPASTAPASAPSASSASAPETSATVSQADPPAAAQPAQPQPTPDQSAPAATPEVTTPASTSNTPETPATAAQPNPPATSAQPDPPAATPEPIAAAPQPAAQPDPTPAKPAPRAIRPADTRESWEKPLPSVRTAPLIELYGGFAFARMDNGSGYSATNFNGALGSFGYNIKPWLQLVGDSSYSFVTVSGAKNVLYGNHYGPRYFYRRQNRWHITPFAEGFVGGSRADTTISGSPTTSQNCISFKVGGGIDYRPSRRWEIRLFDVDYYRTSFGTNAHQTNYWASAGIVLRLFGGSE